MKQTLLLTASVALVWAFLIGATELRMRLGSGGETSDIDTSSFATLPVSLTTGVTGTLPIENGGTEATTLTDGGVLLGSGTGAITPMSVLADGSIIVGDGTTDPVSLAAFESSTGDLAVTAGGTGLGSFTDGGLLIGKGTADFAVTAVLADGEMVVGDGTTDPVLESGATLRTSIGVGTGDSPQFTSLTLTGTANLTGTSGSSTLMHNLAVQSLAVNGSRLYLGSGSATTTIGFNINNGGGLTFATTTDRSVFIPAVVTLWGATIPNPDTASTTLALPRKPWAVSASHMTCSVWSGTNAVVRLRDDDGNTTNSITCTTTSTTTEQTLTSGNTFTKYEGLSLEIVSTSGGPDQLNLVITGTTTPQ